MFVGSKSETESKENIVFSYFKGLLISTMISLGLVIVLAFSLKWFELGDGFIVPLTLLIKGVSVLVGAIFAVDGRNKGLLKGAGFGAVYVVFALVIFSILAGGFSVGVSTFLDLVFASLVGGIVGIVKVNKV